MKRTLVFKLVIYCLAAVFLIGVLIYGISTGFGFKDLKKTDEKYSKSYNYTAEATDITDIKIDWLSGLVEFKLGSGKEIQIKESAEKELDEKDKLILESNDGTLKISWNGEPWYTRIGLFKESKKLVVVVPKTMALGSVSINATSAQIKTGAFAADSASFSNAAGNITTSGIKAGNIEIKSASGNISASKLLSTNLTVSNTSGKIEVLESVSDKYSVKSVSGDINVTGAAADITAQSVSGNISFQSGIMPASTNVGAVSGRVTLKIPENEGFILKNQSVSGNLTTSLQIQTQGDINFYKNPSSANKVELQTTSGEMELELGQSMKKVTTYSQWKVARAKKEAESSK